MTNLNKSRGYAFEYDVTSRINRYEHWHAWRLGGTQIALPDVLAVNNERSLLAVFELKSTQDDAAIVMSPQIERLHELTEKLSIYKISFMIIGFKFRNKTGAHRRPIREYFFGVHKMDSFKCKRDGSLYRKSWKTGNWERMSASAHRPGAAWVKAGMAVYD